MMHGPINVRSDKWFGTGIEGGSNNWKWKVGFSLYLVSVIAERNL